MQFLLVFLALYVGMVQSWDIAISAGDDTLSFYTNQILTRTTSIKYRKITVLAYDEVHNLMLYVDSQTNNNVICGYDLTSAENKCFTQGSGRNIHGLAFDPVTERVFFTDTNDRSVNWISLKPGFKNNGTGHLLIRTSYGIPRDIVVDSCKGFVYWLNTNLAWPTIERVRVDGTEREVFETLTSIPVNARTLEPNSLAIDQQSHAIYWTEPVNTLTYGLFTRALNGRQKTLLLRYTFVNEYNRLVIPTFTQPLNTLTVSKNYVFFRGFVATRKGVAIYSKPGFTIVDRNALYSQKVYIVANYKIKDQIQGIQDCEALSQVEVASEYEKTFCVHGTKVFGQSACKCTLGYTGEKCDVSICENYCLKGNCRFNNEGHPECRCSAGYSGERCQVSVCEGYCSQGNCSLNDEGAPECSCNAGYSGERCQVSVCEGYCSQGNCSLNDEGAPECSCNAGYSGERCQVSVCEGYCSQGNCSLNDEGASECSCNAGYSGERCQVSVCEGYCFQGNCSFNDEGAPECSCNAGYSGERCQVSVCEGYCFQGDCSLNDEGAPECSCNAGYSGERCQISVCEGYCFQGNYSFNDEGAPECSCNAGYSGERCQISVCEGYCFQGNCSLNDEGAPECSCRAGYTGERCQVSVCERYCFQGNCSFNDEGLPECRCEAGYSGQRCEVNECRGYCLNDGECSLNEEDEPSCQCVEGYEGTRCEVDRSDSLTCSCLRSNQPFKSIRS